MGERSPQQGDALAPLTLIESHSPQNNVGPGARRGVSHGITGQHNYEGAPFVLT